MFRHFAGSLLLLIFYVNVVAQCPITVSAGPDVVSCTSPASLNLSGSITGDYLGFTWSPTTGMTGSNTLSPHVNVTQTTNYILTATALDASVNLINNGDFEQGVTSFSSDYIYSPGDLYPEGVYDVLTNPSSAHPNFPACGDHTTGSTNMLAVNGSGAGGVDVWCQTVSVTPNTQYIFTAWATSLVAASPARLQFSINGTNIGSIFNVSSQTCTWQNFYAVWNSGSATSATICIVNQNTAQSGNDFAVDDIVFSPTCKVSDTVRVEVVNLKAMAAVSSVFLPCEGSTATLSGAGSSVGPGIMYNWQTPDGNIVSGANTLNPVIDSPGAYTLTVSFETASGEICEKFVTVNVYYTSNPLTAIIVPPLPLGCGVASVTMVGNATPSIANVTYQWSVVTTGHFVGSTTNKNAVVNQPGIYELLVTNSITGCTSTAQMTVTAETSLPVANATSDTINCIQSTAVLSGAGSSTGAGYTYQWTTPNGMIVQGQNSQNAEAGVPGTYILSVTNLSNGCVVRDTVIVIADKTLPFSAIDPPEAIDCNSDTIELFVNLSPPPFVLLVWTATDGGNIASGEYTPNPKVTAPGTYILHTTDPLNGCVSIDTVAVITNYAPPTAATLPADSLTCVQNSVVLSGTGSSVGFNYGYEWTTALGNIVDGEETLTPEVNAPGLYTLTVLNYFNGCTATSSVLVSADTNAVTAVSHVTDTLDCLTLSTTLNAIGSTSGNNISYAWTTPGGMILNGADTSTPLVSAPGVYVLTLTNSANGCSATSQVTVMQDTMPPIVTIATPNQLTCSVPTQSITANPLQPSSTYTYTWTASAGGHIFSGVNNAGINVDAAGAYQVLVGNTHNGCTATFSTLVTQEAGIPVVLTSADGPLTCADTIQTLHSTGSSSGTEYVYTWSALNGGNILSGNALPDPLIDAPGTYVLQILNQNNGCIASDTIVVLENIVAPPVAAGQGGILTCLEPDFTLNGNENLPTTNLLFQWNTTVGNFSTNPNSITTICDAIGTYYLFVTDTINGCMSVDSLVMTENKQAPSLFVQPSFPITCAVTSLNLSATASGSTALLPIYHWQTSNGHIISGDSTATPLIDAPGNYAITVTDPANGCTKNGGAIVSQNTTAPPVQVLPADIITCTTPIQTLLAQNQSTASNFSYAWSASNGGQITAGDTTLMPTVNAAGMYLLTALNLANGCETTDSVEVFQNTTPPFVDAGVADTLNCLNNSLSITGAASGQGTLSYLWAPSGGGHISSGDTTLVPTVDMPGLYVLSVTDQINGCMALDSVEVLEDANVPLAEAGQATILDCNVLQTSLQGSGSTGSTYSYLWTTNDGHIQGDSSTLNPIVDAPGTYLLSVFNASNGCARTDSVLIPQNIDKPDITIITPGLLTCSTVSLQLNAQTSVPGGIFSWMSPDGNIVSGSATSTPTINEPGMYITMATDPVNGCSSTDSILVGSNTVTPELTVQTPSVLTCTLTEIPITGNVVQPQNNYAVHWTTIGGTFVSGQNSLSPQVSAPGTYQMNVLDQTNGCNAFVSVLVEEDVLLPIALAASSQPLTCDSTVVTLSATGSSSGSSFTYLWTGPNVVSGQTSAHPLAGDSGPYVLVVTNETNGCTAFSTAIVSSNTTPPTIAIANPLALTCTRESIVINAGGSSSGASFQSAWSTSTGHFISGQNTLTPQIDEPATYILTIENTVNGCTSTQSVQVPQNIVAPVASIAPVEELNCNRQEANLLGSSNTNVNFFWTTSGGQILSGATSATPLIAAAGNYQLVVTNPDNGCTGTAQTIVMEATAPDFLPVMWQPDCHIKTGAVDFGPVDGGKAPFRYSVNGGQSYQSDASFENLNPGMYTLVVQDAYGCTAVEEREVLEPFLPVVTLEGLHTLELGDSVQLLPILNLPANNISSWEWSPATGLSCADCPQPTAKPLESGSYSLLITDLNGCIAEARTQFRVNRNRVLYPPNIISPNGDGKNDFFNLFGKGVTDIRWLRIYDRWGNQLYDVEHLPINDEMQGWNGVFRGQPVSPGVFVWQAMVTFIDGVSEIFSGDVTVMR